MFVGHLAVALGAKTIERRLPLSALIAGSFGLDLLWPVLLLAGIERVRIDPGNTAFTPLAFDHYPWSHSLATSIVWGAAAALIVRRRVGSARASTVLAAVVVSHWVLDFVTHRPDLPVWPGSAKVGLGLWNSIAGTLLVEGSLFALAIVVYQRAFRAQGVKGVFALWSLVVLTAAIWISGPWSPPPPSAAAVAVVGLAMWLFPVWGAWIERNRGRA